MSLFGATVSRTGVVTLHIDVTAEEGDLYFELDKITPDNSVEWCAFCGYLDDCDRLCDSCCAREECNNSGLDFLDLRGLGIDGAGKLVVSGKFVYTRDYWGEWDMEFEVESHKFASCERVCTQDGFSNEGEL